MSNSEFVTRKGLVIKGVTSGSTETEILVKDANGLVKYNTIEGLLPQVGENYDIIFRDSGTTSGYNALSGFTFDPVSGYLKVGNNTGATSRIHIYGENDSPYSAESVINPDSAIFIDGSESSDKSLVFGDGGVEKWTLQTYRDENGDYLYVYNPMVDNNSLTMSRSGRMGVNKQSNVMLYHPQYMDPINGLLNDLEIGGWYDRLYQALYEIQITGLTPDVFRWRKSRDNGIEWNDWSNGISIITGTSINIEYNITFTFKYSTGHSLFDRWRFTAFPQLPQGTFTVAANGYNEILITSDYTQNSPVYNDVTNGLSTTYAGFETCLSGLTDAIYVGWGLPYNSIFFNNGQNASGVTLKFEYYSSSGWTEILTGESYGTLKDFTNNLTMDGKVEWDRQELDWVKVLLTGKTNVDEYFLYWIRITTSTIPTIAPVVDSLSLGGTNRFAVYSAHQDPNPSFYVDGAGRVILGDYNHLLSDSPYTNTGYLGVNTTRPMDMIHIYGLDTNPDETNTMHNHLMIDGVTGGDKGIMYADNGVKKFEDYLYRNEGGEFKYTHSYAAEKDIMVVSEGGRFGINWASPTMNSHSIYYNTSNNGINSLIIGGVYDKKILRYYEVKITNISTTPNKFQWRESINYGTTWTDYSVDISCSLDIINLDNGIEISFSDLAGHSLNDYWRFWAFPQLPGASLAVSADMYKGVYVCYDTSELDPLYQDKTYNSSSIFTPGYQMLSGITSLMYVGNSRDFNSIYVGLSTPASGLTLKVEYLGVSGWTEMTSNNDYNDQTNNLTASNLISWDTSTMNWNSQIATGMTESMNWIRLTTTTNPIVNPECYLVSPHGLRRFGVRSGHLDPIPSFYIDAIGRTIMGDYQRLGSAALNGYLGVNITEPQNIFHTYGIDNVANSNNDMHNNIMVDGVSDGDKGYVIADDGTLHWEDYIYRNENGHFRYLYNYELDRDIYVVSQGGRFGINKQSNILDYHSHYQDNINGSGLHDLIVVSGLYNKNYQLTYDVKITSSGSTDTWAWRKKRYEWTSWSSNYDCITGLTYLENGISIQFENTTGHNLFDAWDFTAYPQLQSGTFTVAPPMFDEVIITDDDTNYIDVTHNVADNDNTITLSTGSTTTIYIGLITKFSSVFIGLNSNSNTSGFTTQIEYYDTNSGWTILSTNIDFYDATNNLTKSEMMSWEDDEISWGKTYPPNHIEDGYNLYWIKLSSSSNIINSPIISNITPHSNYRIASYSSFLDNDPEFYIDGQGRLFDTEQVIIGSTGYTANSKLEVYSDVGKILDVTTGGTVHFNQYTNNAYLKTINSNGQIDTSSTFVADVLASMGQELGEPIGFRWTNTDSIIDFDATGLTFSIVPTGSTFEFYVKGIRFDSTGVTLTIPDVTSRYFFYFDDNGDLKYETIFDKSFIFSKVFVAVVYWNAEKQTTNLFR